ncbi:MAG: hypothetical protein PHN44_00620 [Candidatus Marinimicrobia bacterium]|nr:hypothetical protein [Candidatus Neomarinimicrobiota bacterium]MDD5539131.1 hypothetical protein [Candidatus Neomarinimicrobiota bacterium]
MSMQQEPCTDSFTVNEILEKIICLSRENSHTHLVICHDAAYATREALRNRGIKAEMVLGRCKGGWHSWVEAEICGVKQIIDPTSRIFLNCPLTVQATPVKSEDLCKDCYKDGEVLKSDAKIQRLISDNMPKTLTRLLGKSSK